MHIRNLRFLTAASIMLVCLFAMVRGWNVARFSLAQQFSSPDKQAQALAGWVGYPGLNYDALEASQTVVQRADEGQTRKRIQDVERMLEARPLSARDWFVLASLRKSLGQNDKAVAALTVSMLSGPNEGSLLGQRGVFGVSLWDALPAEVRRHAIADLAAGTLTTSVKAQLALILASKTLKTREEIRAALVETRSFDDKTLAEFGIAPRQGVSEPN